MGVEWVRFGRGHFVPEILQKSWHLCCLLSQISPLERLFVLSRTQRAREVEIFVSFSLKPLRCGDPALLR